MATDSWSLQPLGNLFPKIVVGYVGNVNKYYCDADTGVPFYRTLNIRDGHFRHDEIRYVTREFNNKNKKSQIENGDVVIARVGANLGMTCQVTGLQGSANMANAIIIKAKHAIDADPDFFAYYLVSPMGKNQIFSGAAGGAQGVFNTKLTQEILVPNPPLPEQKKIAQILSTWDQAITATERLLENSQQRKKGLMQQLLTGKKRLPGFEGEWKTVELGSLGSTYSGLSGKTKEDFGNGEPFVTYMGVFSDGALKTDRFDYVRLSEGESQNKVQYGDILFTTSSETPEEVGMASVLLETLSYNLYLNSFCFGFRPHSFEDMVPEYARYLFRGEEMRRRISVLAQGATRYNLSKKQLVKLDVLLPGKSEQAAISQILVASDMEISAVNHRLVCLREEKKALMQQLLTGKRRVKVEANAA